MAVPKFPLEVTFKGIDNGLTKVFEKVQGRIDRVTDPLKRVNARFRQLSEFSGLNRLSGALRGVGSSVLGVAQKVGGLLLKFTGLVTAASAGAFAIVKSFAGAGDQIAKTADKLGIGIEALQEYRFAADRSGISVQTFDMALQRAGRRVAEAAQGTGEAVKALQELGVSAVDSQGKARMLEDLMPELADKFRALEGPTDRMRLAMKLFDSEGVALVNMLGLGAEGVDKLRREARGLGLVMTEEAARGSESFVDSQTNLAAALTGVRNVIGASLMPTVQGFLDQLKTLVIDRRYDIQRFAEAFVDRLPGYLEQLRDRFRRLVGQMQPLINIGKAIVDRFGAMNTFVVAVGGAITVTLAPALAVATKAFFALGAAMLTTPVGWILGGLAAIATAFYKWDEISDWWNDLWRGIWSNVGKWIDAMVDRIGDFFDGIVGWFGDLFGVGNDAIAQAARSGAAPRGEDLRQQVAAGAPVDAARNENVVKVSFDNVPRGVDVTPERTSGDFELDVGYGLAGA